MRQFSIRRILLISNKLLGGYCLHRNLVIDKKGQLTNQWYDNEWGYSNKVVDLIEYIAAKQPALAKK